MIKPPKLYLNLPSEYAEFFEHPSIAKLEKQAAEAAKRYHQRLKKLKEQGRAKASQLKKENLIASNRKQQMFIDTLLKAYNCERIEDLIRQGIISPNGRKIDISHLLADDNGLSPKNDGNRAKSNENGSDVPKNEYQG